LGRVCKYGTVKVEELMVVERYSHVMHLVSSLRGELVENADLLDTLMACFPAGTVSGAPKVRAMEIIDQLETTRRGVYSGAIMYVDFSNNLDSCIAIRTLVARGGKGYVQAGGGIVADSVPENEYTETVNKSRALIRAIDLALGGFELRLSLSITTTPSRTTSSSTLARWVRNCAYSATIESRFRKSNRSSRPTL